MLLYKSLIFRFGSFGGLVLLLDSHRFFMVLDHLALFDHFCLWLTFRGIDGQEALTLSAFSVLKIL